jgi:hypothetical protein
MIPRRKQREPLISTLNAEKMRARRPLDVFNEEMVSALSGIIG